jgi:tellurite resistance protein TerC
VRQTGNRWTTLLLAALVVVETSDILFAVDSVHAVLSVTQTAFVAYLLIVFAVLGLRALYFVLEGLIARFVYLQLRVGRDPGLRRGEVRGAGLRPAVPILV